MAIFCHFFDNNKVHVLLNSIFQKETEYLVEYLTCVFHEHHPTGDTRNSRTCELFSLQNILCADKCRTIFAFPKTQRGDSHVTYQWRKTSRTDYLWWRDFRPTLHGILAHGRVSSVTGISETFVSKRLPVVVTGVCHWKIIGWLNLDEKTKALVNMFLTWRRLGWCTEVLVTDVTNDLFIV